MNANPYHPPQAPPEMSGDRATRSYLVRGFVCLGVAAVMPFAAVGGCAVLLHLAPA